MCMLWCILFALSETNTGCKNVRTVGAGDVNLDIEMLVSSFRVVLR